MLLVAFDIDNSQTAFIFISMNISDDLPTLLHQNKPSTRTVVRHQMKLAIVDIATQKRENKRILEGCEEDHSINLVKA